MWMFSSGFSVSGGTPDQNLILLDGVTVYNPTHAFGLLSTFNNDAIGGLSLFKGAYPAEYGGRLGAVVDVASKQPDPPRLRAELGVSIIAARALVDAARAAVRRLRWVRASSGRTRPTPRGSFYILKLYYLIVCYKR